MGTKSPQLLPANWRRDVNATGFRFRAYHYTENDYRTELYYFRIIFVNSCSVMCFHNDFVSEGGWNLATYVPEALVLSSCKVQFLSS